MLRYYMRIDPTVLSDDEYIEAYATLKYIRAKEKQGQIDDLLKNLLI